MAGKLFNLGLPHFVLLSCFILVLQVVAVPAPPSRIEGSLNQREFNASSRKPTIIRSYPARVDWKYGTGIKSFDKERASTNGGRLVRISQSAIDTEKVNCVCAPRSRCTLTVNQAEGQRDTVCPNNLIQCCGKVIEEQPSSGFMERMDLGMDYSDPTESPENTRLEELFGNINRFNLESSLIPTTVVKTVEADPFQNHYLRRLPVQLPVMKIPVEAKGEPSRKQTHPTVPPPKLPSYYHESTPAPYDHLNIKYIPIVRENPIPGHYFSTKPPLTNKFGTPFLINYNGRGFSY